MDKYQQLLSKIHHINKGLNRFLSIPLFIASSIVVFLLLISPYSLRLFWAMLINIFFNRPIVYLNYFSKLIGKPFFYIKMVLIYFCLLGPYALILKLMGKSYVRIHKSDKSSDVNSYLYQS